MSDGLVYPSTRRDDVVEMLHGIEVADPYRWLEDPDSAETAAWVRAQNEVSERYLAGLPERAWFTATMRGIVERPRTGVPFVRAGRYFVTRNDGRQNQDVWYVADSLEELLAGGRVLIDPNQFSVEGTDSVGSFTVDPRGRLACYGRCEGGSDWQTFVLIDLDTGVVVDDVEIQTKFSAAAWLPDGRSYVYTDYAHAGAADGTKTDKVAGGRLRLHRLGQQQVDDRVLAEFPDNPQLMPYAEVSNDDRFVVVGIVEGTENRNLVWLLPILGGGLDDTGPGISRLGEPLKLIDTAVAEFGFVRMDGDRVLFATDLEAPRGRVVSCDLDLFERTERARFVELIPEGEATVDQVIAAGSGLVVSSLVDASPLLTRYRIDGSPLGVLDIAGGAVVGLSGEPDEADLFVGMSSVTELASVYAVGADTGVATALPGLLHGAAGAFTPPAIGTLRAAATSRDGTRIPYFLITPEGAPDGPRPVLLWGYGGFKISIQADYRHGWSGWLAAGGTLAIANLRGGGEYGTEWYEQGRLGNKQNVFDDFIAVAEDLVASGVTTSGQLAIHGRSNGGLLVGAALTQRPDLFAASIPAVGVLDLLRFHRFTIGAAWISDYGDPDDPGQFADALAYSPLHNVRPATAYPPTLVLTGDHDDRVVPLHSHKFTAALQHAQTGPAPILTRVEVATGHGVGKPSALVAAEWADLLAFAAHHTGLEIARVERGPDE